MKKTWIVFLLVFFSACLTPAARWVKGNTHAHTNRSDGNEYPHRVARWYQDHGYQFLFITDHDMVTPTAPLDADGSADDFIIIPGEEISLTLGRRQAHVNSLNPRSPAAAKAGATMAETLQNAIDAALRAGGLPQINHPFRRWSISADDMKGLRGVRLFEVLNMPRESNNFPAGGSGGTEGLWDELLTSGMVLYGVAADDSHDFHGEFLPGLAHPGRGWVVARVNQLTAEEVCAALEKGDFYASTGIELADLQVGDREYRLTVKPHRETRYTTFFIGGSGRVLAQVDGLDAVYAYRGDETYVRAKVVSSMGEMAFCQPVLVRK